MAPLIDSFSFEQEAASLNKTLRQLKREGYIIFTLSGLVWTFAVLLLSSAVFTAALGWWGGQILRVVGWSSVLFGFVAVLGFCLWKPIRGLGRNDAVLMRIGRIYPSMASDVRTAGQLARSVGSSPFSPMLMTAEIRMVRGFLDSVIPEKQIFPRARLVAPIVALLLSSAVFAVGWTTVPEIIEAGAGALFTDHSPPVRSRRVSEKAPVVQDLQVTLKYPEYLKREPRSLDNVSGGFIAPLGTVVSLSGRSLVEGANQGELHLPDGGRVALTVAETGDVHGGFVLGGAGAFFISLGTERLMVDGPTGSIEIEPDKLPVIRLLHPTGRVEMKEAAELELEIEAEDDHGISRIDLVIRGAGGVEIRKTAVRLTDGIRRFKTKYRWSPDSIRLEEDVVLQVELEAFDDDTILGPKSSRTETVEVQFMTPQSRHKSALEEQNSALDGLIDLLAFRLETPVPNGKQTDESFSRFAQMRGQTEDLLAKTAKLIGILSKDSLTPKRVVDTFVQIRQDISNQLLFEGRLYGDDSTSEFRNRVGVDKVTCRLLERAIIRVDDLVIEQQMSRLVKSGGSIESARSELLELLSRYRQTRSETVRRSLLAAIEKMEREMANLEKSIEQIRGKVGDAFVNPGSMLRMDLAGSLAALKNLLAADDLNGATQLVKRMENDLGRLLTSLEGGLLSFRTERFGEGERFIGELLDRVMSVESEQLQLRRETIALKRSSLERLNDLMRGKIGPLLKRQKVHLEKMRRHKAELQLADDPSAALPIESLETTLQELGLALNQGDLEEARQIASDARDLLEDAAPESGRKNRPVLELLRIEASNIADEIDEAYPLPAQLLTDKDARQAAARAVEQRYILSKTRKLKAWVKKQSDETRFLSSQAVDSLSETLKRMVSATSELEARRVGQALAEQTAALDELAGLREDLKRGDEVSPIESRPLVLGARVEVPSASEFEVPQEFRDDILEAMRGDLPNQYEEAIKKYYEALVQ